MNRKWILRGIVAVVLLFVVAVVVLALSLGAIVKKGVETIGPQATKVDVRLKGAEVWLVGGRVKLSGLFLGNPPGCKTPSAVEVGDVSVSVKPGSVFSPKIIVDTIELKQPLISLEGGLNNNNLTQIEKNLNDYLNGPPSAAPAPNPTTNGPADASSPATQAESGRKLQVNNFLISGAKLQITTALSGGRTITVAIPEIHLTGLGAGPDGITGAEVGKKALDAVLSEATKAFAANASELGKEALSQAKDAVKKVDVKKMEGKLKGLFQ
jgi:uncharacterized protein involved in outer membrane biogenesis